MKITAEDLVRQRVPPWRLLGTTQAFRDELRAVLPAVPIASERAIAALRREVAETHGTKTDSFDEGAWIRDPLRVINTIAGNSPSIAVGADTGSEITKLGITYILDRVSKFAPILMYRGLDDYAQLHQFLLPSQEPFTGDSAHFKHLWEFIDY